MSRMGWGIAGVLAGLGVGVLVGRGIGPAPVEFPSVEEARSETAMFEAVEDALREPRGFVRAATLTRLFEGLSPANLPGARRAIAARSAQSDPVDLQIFVSAWIQIEPEVAAREILSWPVKSRRQIAFNGAIREWAANGEGIAAANFVQQLEDLETRKAVLGPLVRGWALSGDVQGAVSLAERLWHEEDRDVVDGFMRGLLHVAGPESTLDLVKQVLSRGQDPFQQRFVRVGLSLAGRESPEVAGELLSGAAEDGVLPEWLAPQLDETAKVWRATAPRETVEWLLDFAPGPIRNRALNESAGFWAVLDFESAWQWFQDERPAVRGTDELDGTDSALLAGLIRKLARLRPPEAAEWLPRLREGPLRDAMARRIAFFWGAQDQSAASAWIDGLALSEKVSAPLREAVKRGVRSVGQASEAAEKP